MSGSIPALYNNPVLEQVYFNGNQLKDYNNNTGYPTTSLPSSLTVFYANDNLLTQDAVDYILKDLNDAGGTGGTVVLNGTGNASPSVGGLSYTASLISKGWTVLVN